MSAGVDLAITTASVSIEPSAMITRRIAKDVLPKRMPAFGDEDRADAIDAGRNPLAIECDRAIVRMRSLLMPIVPHKDASRSRWVKKYLPPRSAVNRAPSGSH